MKSRSILGRKKKKKKTEEKAKPTYTGTTKAEKLMQDLKDSGYGKAKESLFLPSKPKAPKAPVNRRGRAKVSKPKVNTYKSNSMTRDNSLTRATTDPSYKADLGPKQNKVTAEKKSTNPAPMDKPMVSKQDRKAIKADVAQKRAEREAEVVNKRANEQMRKRDAKPKKKESVWSSITGSGWKQGGAKNYANYEEMMSYKDGGVVIGKKYGRTINKKIGCK